MKPDAASPRATILCLALTLAVLLAGALAAPYAHAVESKAAVSLYNEGNRAYADGDYKAAIAKYREAVFLGIRNHMILYNLGNACFKAGRLGEAILYYERGLRLNPDDPDLRYNLEFVRAQTVDELQIPELGFFGRLWLRARQGVSARGMLNLFSGMYLGLCACVLGAILLRARRRLRGALIIASAALGLLLAALSPLLYAEVNDEILTEQGIVLKDMVNVRSGPGEDFATVFTVHEGMRVAVRQDRGDWIQITISSGFSGWIPREVFETL